jgi:multidrug efflux pump subunit AcrA (membrane-fusion protein)
LETLSVAPPLTTLLVPRFVAPSKNVTVPAFGEPAPVVIVAVNVKAAPYGEGLSLDVRIVVVVAEHPVSATATENGVSTTPENAMLSTFQPGAPAALSLPKRKRMRTVDPGAMALPGSPLLGLEGGALRLEVLVPESVLPHVKHGSSVSLRIDALGGERTGQVDEIDPQGDAASHTFLVKLRLKNDTGVRSAMFGRAFLQTGITPTVRIPKQATWEREGLHFVYVVNLEGLARLRIVTLRDPSDDAVTVLSGLSPGERIVVSGVESIADGMKVAPR